MRKVLGRFVFYDGSLTLKMSKMALNSFWDKTLYIFLEIQLLLEHFFRYFIYVSPITALFFHSWYTIQIRYHYAHK